MIEGRTQQPEDILRAHLENAPEAIYLSDLKGTFLYGNQKAEHITGYKKEELIGSSFLKLHILPQTYLVKAAKLLALNVLGKTTGPDEFEINRKDGNTVRVEITTTPVTERGKVIIIGFVRDITERKKIEEELVRNRDLLNETGKMAKVGGWEFDIETRQQTWTEEVYRIHELAPDHQPTVDEGIKYYAPEAIPIISKAVERAIEHGEPFDVVLQLITAKGNRRWVHAIGRAYKRNGKVVKVGGVFQDITERKRAEDELRKYELIENNSRDIIFLVNYEDGRILEANAAAASAYGYSHEKLLTMTIGDLRAPDTRGQIAQQMTEANTRGILFETYHRHHDSTIFPVEVSSRGVTIGDARMLISVIRDITERKHNEEQLVEWQKKYDTLIENATEGISVTQDGSRKFVNNKLIEMYGYSKEELMEKPFIELMHPDDRDLVTQNYQNLLRGESSSLYSYRVITKTGEIRWFEFKGVAITWEGRPASLSFVTDITERKRDEERLHESATHDALTGLPNRALFYDRFDIALANAQRKNKKVAVLSLDLDRFKNINDVFGHEVGDKVLIAAAERLVNSLRKIDTVARFGGDEFVVLAGEINYKDDAGKVAQKIVEAFRQPLIIDGRGLNPTVSIGIAVFPEHGTTIKDLLKASDDSMYQVKDNGRNNYQLYNAITT